MMGMAEGVDEEGGGGGGWVVPTLVLAVWQFANFG